MATRSLIGMELEDGTVESIYCHFDGYLDNNGWILQRSYNTAERVSELISLGGIRSLGDNLYPTDGNADDVTVAYARDLGEEHQIETYGSKEEFFVGGRPDFGAQFLYLFTRNDEWEYLNVYSGDGVLPLPEFSGTVHYSDNVGDA